MVALLVVVALAVNAVALAVNAVALAVNVVVVNVVVVADGVVNVVYYSWSEAKIIFCKFDAFKFSFTAPSSVKDLSILIHCFCDKLSFFAFFQNPGQICENEIRSISKIVIYDSTTCALLEREQSCVDKKNYFAVQYKYLSYIVYNVSFQVPRLRSNEVCEEETMGFVSWINSRDVVFSSKMQFDKTANLFFANFEAKEMMCRRPLARSCP